MSLPEVFDKDVPEFLKNILYKYLKLPGFDKIEIEARIGHIASKITGKRINYNIEYPVVFKELPGELRFISSVDRKDFVTIKNTITEKENVVRLNDRVTIGPNHVRKIESDGKIMYEKKVKTAQYTIYLPEFKYDVRVSVSKENEAHQTSFKNLKNMIIRVRERESCRIGASSFDFTEVSNEKKASDDKYDKKVYEIEMELKDPENGLEEFVSAVFSFPILKR